MSRWFPDPDRPLAGCTGEACSACPAHTRVQCHFGGRDLLRFLLIGAQWLLLAVFGALVVAMGSLMHARMCRRCMNFACPFNAVDPAARAAFFARNPAVARAWKGTS